MKYDVPVIDSPAKQMYENGNLRSADKVVRVWRVWRAQAGCVAMTPALFVLSDNNLCLFRLNYSR